MGAKWIVKWYVIEISLPSPQIIQEQYFGRGTTNTEFQAELDTSFCVALLQQHPNFHPINEVLQDLVFGDSVVIAGKGIYPRLPKKPYITNQKKP